MDTILFWILTFCLFVLAALFVLVPVWRQSRGSSQEAESLRRSENIALFHERQDELETELSSGNMEQEQFDALLAELQQKLLADVDDDERRVAANREQASAAKPSRFRVAIPISFALLMPLLAYGLYFQWGYIDDVEMMELFERTVNNNNDPEEAQSLIVSLGQSVQDDNDQPWTWYFLAENFANLGMFTEAEIAYQQSAGLMEDTPEKALVLGRVALAMYINAELKFTPEILAVVEQARAINPSEISILQLLAADAEEREDYQAAIEYWRLLLQANPNSGQAQVLRQSIAAAQQILQGGNSQDVATGPVVEVNLSLAEGLEVDPNLRVFIAARNAAREGMPPVAATDLVASELPVTLRLDNSSAVGPFNLESADTIYVSALVSNVGTATPRSGDYRVVSDNIAHAGQHVIINLVISDQVP